MSKEISLRVIVLAAAALLLTSCGEVTPSAGGWYCWSPDTELHDGPCVDECMNPGDPHSYCWCETGCFGVEKGE